MRYIIAFANGNDTVYYNGNEGWSHLRSDARKYETERGAKMIKTKYCGNDSRLHVLPF